MISVSISHVILMLFLKAGSVLQPLVPWAPCSPTHRAAPVARAVVLSWGCAHLHLLCLGAGIGSCTCEGGRDACLTSGVSLPKDVQTFKM